jgi:hypothetical protein
MQRAGCLGLVLGMLSCAHDQGLQARLASAEENAREAEASLQEADRCLRMEELGRAGQLLADVRERVDDRQMVYYPDRENLEDRLKSAQARLDMARDVKRRQETASKAVVHKEKVDKAVAKARAALEPLLKRQDPLTRKLTKSAHQAIDDVRQLLNDGKPLESNADYARYVQSVNGQLTPLLAQLAIFDGLLAFLEGPVARHEEARTLLGKASAEKETRARGELWTAAKERFLTCVKDGSALVSQSSSLAGELLLVQSQKMTPQAFIASCDAEAKSVDALLNPPATPTKATTKSGTKKKRSRKKNRP